MKKEKEKYPYKPGCWIYNKHFYRRKPHWTLGLWLFVVRLPGAMWKLLLTPAEWDLATWVALSLFSKGTVQLFFRYVMGMSSWHAWHHSGLIMCFSLALFTLMTINARRKEELLKNKLEEEELYGSNADGPTEPCRAEQ